MAITLVKPTQNIPTVYAHFRDKDGKSVSVARTIYGATPEQAAEIFDQAVNDQDSNGRVEPPEDNAEATGNGKTKE